MRIPRFPMIGTQLGHYRIVSRLGSGGMGVVWLADDLELGRSVALKTLHGEIEAGAGQLARFRREARAVASLNHPNIVTLYSVEEALGLRFLVMEYVDGVRLDDLLPLDGMAPLEVVRIGAEIADALATAHERGIVHRDLKPGNVLVARDGRVKVVDFGIARAYEIEETPSGPRVGDTSMTLDGHAVGTLHYMSPEQLGGHAVDHRTDLYALGVVLHEMTTGRKPFSGNSVVSVTAAINTEVPKALDPATTGLPAAVCALVAELLAKRPSERPDSAARVRDLLLDGYRALGGDAVRSPRAVPPARPFERDLALAPANEFGASLPGGQRARGRSPARVAIAVLAIAASALAGTLLLIRDRRDGASVNAVSEAGTRPAATPAVRGEPPAIAILPLANYTGDPDYFVDGMTDGVIGALARIHGLRVISRQSTMHYKGSDKRLPDIARELGVDYVVEGSLRREAGQIRVEATLFQPTPERPLWTESYTRESANVLALHADVARGLTRALRLDAAIAGGRALGTARSVDPAVYEAFLRGRRQLEGARPENLRSAQASFEEALRRDANFAPAWVGLASLHGLQASFYENAPTNAQRMKEAATRALALDPGLPEAHVLRGDHLRFFDWNWAAAEASYREALRIDPSNAEAHRGLWGLLACLGRLEESRRAIEMAHRLDPLSVAPINLLGFQALFEGALEEAVQRFRRVLEIDANYPAAHAALWAIADLTGDPVAYRAELAAWLGAMGLDEFVPSTPSNSSASPEDLARTIGTELERQSRTRRISTGVGVSILASAGEIRRAVSWLERALAERDPELIWISQDPGYRRLWSDPDFQDIARRVGLPPRVTATFAVR